MKHDVQIDRFKVNRRYVFLFTTLVKKVNGERSPTLRHRSLENGVLSAFLF